MKTAGIHIFLIFCVIQITYSQAENGAFGLDIPARNSLMFNRFLENPTFSFVREQNKYISATNKREFIAIEDAPSTYLFNFSGRLKENMGAGLAVFQQDYGVLSMFGAITNFAYNIRIQEDSNFTFGTNIGAYKSGINTGNVNVNLQDPALNNIPSNFLVTASPSFNYGTGFMDFGLTLSNVVTYNFNSSTLLDENSEKGIQGHIMYTGYLGGYGFFGESRFSALGKTEFQKNDTVLSGVLMLTVPKGIWVQAGYNTIYGASGGIGVNLTPQLAIEYNYEKPFMGLTDLGAAHEFTLAYRFKNNNYYDYSRDDDMAGLIMPSTGKKKKAKKKVVVAQANPTIEPAPLPEAENSLKEIEEIIGVDTKTKIAAEKKAEADERNRIAKENKVATNVKEQERIAAENKATAEFEVSERIEAESRTEAEEAQRARIAAENVVKALEAEIKANEKQLKIDAEEQERIAAEMQIKQENKENERIAAALKAKEDADAQLKIEAENKLQLEREAQERIAAELLAKEKADAQLKIEAENKLQLEREEQERISTALEAEKLAKEEAIANPTDNTGIEMNTRDANVKELKVEQKTILKALDEAITIKSNDLEDLRNENDLSEQGKFVAPKPFKSVTAENQAIETLKEDIDKTLAEQGREIEALETLYRKRIKEVSDKKDETNLFFKERIESLKNEQKGTERSRAFLLSTLKEINEATAFERKRRIKRAAYNNDTDRYEQDKAQLTLIKTNTPLSNEPLDAASLDFGEERNNNIQILKNVDNTENGFYTVVAVHSSVEKRDRFLTKVVASGIKEIEFFFDVNTSKYYIYTQRYDSLQEANQAIDIQLNKVFNSKISVIKIEN